MLVYRDRVIARGMNATNVSRNGTRHAELMALSALLSYSPASDLEPKNQSNEPRPTSSGRRKKAPLSDKTNNCTADPYILTNDNAHEAIWGDVDPRDGHLYPYGQKLHPSPRVDRSVITECILYVTVEPCVMCASLLRQLGIKKVYFGAVNDKFGGTGGVFRIHKNSPRSMVSAPPSPMPQNGKGIVRPSLAPRPVSSLNLTTTAEEMDSPAPGESNNDENANVSNTALGGNIQAEIEKKEPEPEPVGDGGNVERGYEAEGGWGRDEAVTLLRQFYVQENGRGK